MMTKDLELTGTFFSFSVFARVHTRAYVCMPYNCECRCPLYMFISLLTDCHLVMIGLNFNFVVCKSYTDTVCRAANCYVSCNTQFCLRGAAATHRFDL